MKTIVISAINLRQGGPLTILKDCLNYLSNSSLSKTYRIIALVNKKELALFPNIEYIEFPDSIKSWFRRLYYEYFYFRKLSNKLKPYLWLSLHDTTPNVKSEIRAVYMHNASIVNKIKYSDWKFNKKYIAFAFFYKYLYKINIKKNKYCIVQQSWFKQTCIKMLGLNPDKIIVARPTLEIEPHPWSKKTGGVTTFFYPAFPRPFKNFEVICEAAKILENKGITEIEIILTIDGTTGEYGKWIYEKYKGLKTVRFIGLIPLTQMNEYYDKTDCLLFPSRLESWGLPISEFLSSERPMIIANEPYAYETAEGGKKVAFFDTNNAGALATIMEKLIKGDYSSFQEVSKKKITGNYADSYKELFDTLLR